MTTPEVTELAQRIVQMEARQQELLAALAAQKQRNDATELDLRQARDQVVAQQQSLSVVQAQLQQTASGGGSSP